MCLKQSRVRVAAVEAAGKRVQRRKRRPIGVEFEDRAVAAAVRETPEFGGPVQAAVRADDQRSGWVGAIRASRERVQHREVVLRVLRGVNLEDGPGVKAAAPGHGAVENAGLGLVFDEPGDRAAPPRIRLGECMEGRDSAGCRVEPEDRSSAVGHAELQAVRAAAATERRAIQISIAALHERAVWRSPVGVSGEDMDRRKGARRADLEYRAVSAVQRIGTEAIGASTAAIRRAVEEAVACLNQRRVRLAAVGAPGERVQHAERAPVLCGRDAAQSKHGSAARRTRRRGSARANRRAVEEPVAPLDDASYGQRAVSHRMDGRDNDVVQPMKS